MIEKLGKSLVFFLLILSLFLLATAWGITSNNIKWAKVPDTKEDGIHDQKLAEIKRKQEEAKLAHIAWFTASETLDELEEHRPKEQAWYADQIALLRTGKTVAGEAKQPAVQALQYERDGKLKTENRGRPLMGPNPDARLASQTEMLAKLKKLSDDIQAELTEVEKLIKLQSDLTEQLLGGKGKTGLIALLEATQRDQRNAADELDVAQREAINGRVGVAALLMRQRQLKSRIAELEKFRAAEMARQP